MMPAPAGYMGLDVFIARSCLMGQLLATKMTTPDLLAEARVFHTEVQHSRTIIGVGLFHRRRSGVKYAPSYSGISKDGALAWCASPDNRSCVLSCNELYCQCENHDRGAF